MDKKSVLIIGGGLGGLFTGAILSKEGLKVTVLEKNTTIGGGLQSFKRFGETFDTGMHVIGGMRPGDNIYRICKYLGIIDKVEIKDVDDYCTDKLYFQEDNEYYTIAQGKKTFIDRLAEKFPEERENISNYVDAIYSIVDGIDLFNLRPSKPILNIMSEDIAISADAFIAKYIKDKKLRSVIAYMNPLYGGRKGQTPAYIHALINVLYINGPSRFVGGSDKFANLLADVIIANGGSVHTNEGAAHINVEEKMVVSVRSTTNAVYSADYYISAIHPCSMLKIIDEKSLQKSYRNRLNEIPNSYSAFSLYIKLKENSFKYINHSEYFMKRYDEIWNFGDTDSDWPLGFLMMTPPKENQGEYASTVLLTAPMPFDCVKRWEDSTVGKRGKDYEQWKDKCADKLINLIEEMHPGFRNCIDKMNTASPLSIRDFYGVKDGALCGYSKDYNNLALSHLPVVTKIKNLLLTGQNNNLHGFCGVPLTAINTSEAILGINYVLNKINEC